MPVNQTERHPKVLEQEKKVRETCDVAVANIGTNSKEICPQPLPPVTPLHSEDVET